MKDGGPSQSNCCQQAQCLVGSVNKQQSLCHAWNQLCTRDPVIHSATNHPYLTGIDPDDGVGSSVQGRGPCSVECLTSRTLLLPLSPRTIIVRLRKLWRCHCSPLSPSHWTSPVAIRSCRGPLYTYVVPSPLHTALLDFPHVRFPCRGSHRAIH